MHDKNAHKNATWTQTKISTISLCEQEQKQVCGRLVRRKAVFYLGRNDEERTKTNCYVQHNALLHLLHFDV